MNNNRCLFCDKIIPEGIQICPKCEKDYILSVTPENKLCRDCKKKCKGECDDFRQDLKKKARKKFHKKQQF